MIEAAGGVVWRRSGDGRLEVLVVRRPADDERDVALLAGLRAPALV